MINFVYQLIAPKVFSIKYEDIDFLDSVIIRPRFMSICHADQRYYLGQREEQVLNKKLPMALIHECCGEVVYDGTGTYKQGTSVALIPNVPGESDKIIYENYAKESGFLSSGLDGFMREYINIPIDRVIPHEGIPQRLACVSEFVSIAAHSIHRFEKAAHERRETIGVWGDGSLAFVVANALKQRLPACKIVVIGRNPGKLSYFSFVEDTFLAEQIPEDLNIDHAFECCGGEGSYYAVEDIIKHINPQGTVMLMGVSENKVAVNTRSVLEKGLTLIGSSRSGKQDFESAIQLMKDAKFQKRMELILFEDRKVSSIADVHRVFRTDLETPFKTIFEWEL